MKEFQGVFAGVPVSITYDLGGAKCSRLLYLFYNVTLNLLTYHTANSKNEFVLLYNI
jgi:hypothetical protein